ncbi:MAG: rod shape-determining protein RodA [candidate division Zixibacteria bacterium CG_4_9_14_3_um_filter_46_8]|nr:MAG: rod shape-determining protein RodA [candidate division Zixibacteria bacterium CG_4_9_14_3_um_filter_46_8]
MRSLFKIDTLIFFPALLLSVIGIIGIYSTGFNEELSLYRGMYIRQIYWLALGIILFLGVSVIPLRFHEGFSYIYYFVSMALLAGVLAYGGSGGTGAVRWFDLGPFKLQPSEVAKVALVFVIARFLSHLKRKFPNAPGIVAVLAMGLIPFALVVKQPDLGTAMVFGTVIMFMLYWSGMNSYHLFLFVSPIVSMIAAAHPIAWAVFLILLLVSLIIYRTDVKIGVGVAIINIAFGVLTPILWNKLHEYQKLRILTFLDPGRDPRGAGYQIIQSKIAIGSGGWIGKGIGEGTQTKLAYLPTQHTDFIFSVIGEAFGFIGITVVLILFAILLTRGITIAAKARKGFLGLASGGLVAIIAFQVIVNIGMTIGLMPVTGLPLPFVSYGGTSMLVFWLMIGVITAVNRDWRAY